MLLPIDGGLELRELRWGPDPLVPQEDGEGVEAADDERGQRDDRDDRQLQERLHAAAVPDRGLEFLRMDRRKGKEDQVARTLFHAGSDPESNGVRKPWG